MKDLKDGIRSHVRLDFKGHVHKKFRGHEREQRCENEARILRALEERSCPYVPQLLEYHPEECYLVTTNCGQPAPEISRAKSDALFAELERQFGIRHDDPEPRNVTYSPTLGRFCLIDFELAELLPVPGRSGPAPSAVWKVTWSSCMAGGIRRDANDDAFLVLEVSPQGVRKFTTHGEALLEPSHLVLAVSDGMGGGSAGELASRLILAWVKRNAAELYHAFNENEEDSSPLLELMRNAHEGLNSLAAESPNLKGMGATLTLAWLSPGRLHLGHIGDSRLYLYRAAKSAQMTVDHTMAWSQLNKGEISEFAYRNHPRRSVLYDVLGSGHATIRPQIDSHPLAPGDRLLLCTDGIIDGLWQGGLAAELASKAEPTAVAANILARARDISRNDDATLIVADIAKL